MAKALKVAAIVAGVAALAIVTGGAAAGVGLSLATTAFGVSASALVLAAGALSTAAALLTKAPKVPASQTERLFANIDPRAFRKEVLGQTAFPIDIRYEEWSGANQDTCDWIVCFASHAIDGLKEIWFNTEMAWSATTGVVGKYVGYFSMPNLVLEGSPAMAFTFASGRWNGSSRLTGCAYARFRFKTTGNSKKAESPFASGIPSRITAIGRGAKLYDPRRDSTVPGGSGPMRADDQSTWRFTADDGGVIGENLPLHILRRVLGWRITNPATGEKRLATGSGVPARRLNLQSFMVAANLADELVNRSAGGTEPRYHGAAVISEGDDPKSTLDMLCGACCGRFRDTGGRLSLVLAHNDLAAAAADEGLLDDDVIGGFTWDPDPALEATPNIVRGRYVDGSTASLYQLIDYPEVRIASPDGQDRVFPLDLAAVESPSHAQRVAKQVLQRLQYQREFSAPFDIRAWKWGVGDVVPFTFAPLGFKRVLFRVKEQELGQGGSCQMTLKVEHASIYAWDRDDAAPVMAADPIVYDSRNNPLILAIDDASRSAEWPNVADPAGTRPDDNATNSADPTSPFGNDTVGGTVKRLGDFDTAIAAAKKRTDALENDTIPAINAAAADAETRITAARTRADQALTNTGDLKQRVDAIVAQGGYDDTDVRAKITQAAGVAANAAQAVGDLSTSVNTRFRGVSDTFANYEQRITALSTGQEGFTARIAIVEAGAMASGSAMNANPDFSIWTTGGPPNAYAGWGAVGTYARLAATLRPAGFMLEHTTAGLNSGFIQAPVYISGGWYVFEAEVWKTSGPWLGAGISLSGAYNLDFARDADIQEVAGNVDRGGGVRTWTKLFKVPEGGGGYMNFHLMGNYEGFAGEHQAKTLRWVRALVRPASDMEIATRKAVVETIPAAIARIKATEDTLADAPNRYAAASRLLALESQVNFATDSGLQRTINARIEDRATAIADSKAGAVAQTLAALRAEYNGTVATVSQQAGTIVDVNYRTRSYWRTLAVAGNSRAQMTVFADDNNGGGVDIIGNVSISGDLTIDGTVTARKFNGASMAREARTIWTGSITPAAGQTVTVPWGLALAQIPPIGRFIYEYTFTLSTNEGTSQFLGYDNRGRPKSIQHVSDGGMTVFASDAQGNIYYPRPNASDRVLATTDFAPNWTAQISRGTTNYTEDDGENIITYLAATYTVTRIDLKVTWVAI